MQYETDDTVKVPRFCLGVISEDKSFPNDFGKRACCEVM